MITPATRIRNKIYEILRPLETTTDIKTIRCVPVGLLQPDDLPAISISLLNERLTPNGDDNMGAFNFDSEVTVGVSVVRGFKKAIELDVQVDDDADLIQRLLLGDADFTRFAVDKSLPEDDPNRDPYFEAVTGITRRRNYPQSGETFLVEVRLEFSFRTSIDFEVCIDAEPLKKVSIRTRSGGANTPQAGVDIDFPENP